MAAGLQVFNADGSLQFDGSTRITRLLGVIGVGGNGSFSHAGLSTGTPFAVFQSYGIGINSTMPAFNFSGNTFSWSFNGPTSSGYFVVGVY